jgi:hypothetical protein
VVLAVRVFHLLRLGLRSLAVVAAVLVAIKAAVQEDRVAVELAQMTQLVRLLLALQILAAVAVVDQIPMRLLLVVRVL